MQATCNAGTADVARDGRYNARFTLEESTDMEPEHLNAIGNALDGLKDRTAQLRRYL